MDWLYCFIYPFLFFRIFFLDKTELDLVFFILLQGYSAKSILVKLLPEELQFVGQFIKNIWWYTSFNIINNIRMYIFWRDMFFNNIIHITFTFVKLIMNF